MHEDSLRAAVLAWGRTLRELAGHQRQHLLNDLTRIENALQWAISAHQLLERIHAAGGYTGDEGPLLERDTRQLLK